MKLKKFLNKMTYPVELESSDKYLVFEICTEKTSDTYPVYDINRFDKKHFIEWATFFSQSEEVVENWRIEFCEDSIHFVIFVK